jgi:hypothetical protein
LVVVQLLQPPAPPMADTPVLPLLNIATGVKTRCTSPPAQSGQRTSSVPWLKLRRTSKQQSQLLQ